MDIYDLVKSRRTVRKFTRATVSHDLLIKFIDHARFAPSGMNAQPVRYMIIDDEREKELFAFTHWAGLLKGAHSPSENERPAAYILFLVPSGSQPKHDVGAIAQTISLLAHSEGIGSCWMGAIDRRKIGELCNVPDGYEIDTLLSLGYPSEAPIACEPIDGDLKYYVDKDGIFKVPKIKTEDLIL